MKTLRLLVSVLCLSVLVGSVPALAQGTSYSSRTSKPIWNGKVVVLDAVTGKPIEGAYVSGKNVPYGYTTLGVQVINNDDGRMFDKTNTAGEAKARVRPLGSLAVWAPGYRGMQDMNFMKGESNMPIPDKNGVLTVKLTPLSNADERRAAAAEAAKWMEYERREPLIYFGEKKKRSEALRKEARETLIREGAPAIN